MSLKSGCLNITKSFGNVICNGFASSLSSEQKIRKVGIDFNRFTFTSGWENKTLLVTNSEKKEMYKKTFVIDSSTNDAYWDEGISTVRKKCMPIFLATLLLQPLGLTLNILNRVGKIVTFAHLWHPSKEEYNFRARLVEWGRDVAVVAATPILLVSMLFASICIAASPYNGRKLYGTLERIAYGGGEQTFRYSFQSGIRPNVCLIAPCCQPRFVPEFTVLKI